jgi:hypothetical protein
MKSVDLFIDANIYLSLYRFSNTDLDELRKLIDAASTGAVSLLKNDLLEEEFERSRETVLQHAIRRFREEKFPYSAPAFASEFSESLEIQASAKALNQKKRDLANKIEELAIQRGLYADEVVGDLFAVAKSTPIDDSVFKAARRRADLRNPPGKQDGKSMGDAVHWESLLRRHNEHKPLAIVSADGDFFGKLDPGAPHPFLLKEWHALSRRGTLHAYRHLTGFFSQHLPEVGLQSELSVDFLISALERVEDPNHLVEIIERLATAGNLTTEQTWQIVNIVYSNRTVLKGTDLPEVQSFLDDLFQAHGGTKLGEAIYELIGDNPFA